MATEKILVVDDSPIDSRFALKILTEAGYTASIVHDGQEALKLAPEFQPDLILLDVNMPRMDGYEVCQRLKANAETKDITVALYTIRDQFLDCLKGIEAGADDFIIKSLSGDDFLNRVKKILSARQAGRTSTGSCLNLSLIRSLGDMSDRRELVQFLYGSFTKHVREAIRLFLGTHATNILIDRALQRAAGQFPHLRGATQTGAAGVTIDPAEIEEVPGQELLEGFEFFNNELNELVTKLTRTRIQGAKEARGVSRALMDMAAELRAKCEELHTPAAPAAEPVQAPSPAAPPPMKPGGGQGMRITKVYTRTGDWGETSLVGGVRVSKASPRVEAYGDIDEANSLIGVARSEISDPEIDRVLRSIQNDLFTVGTDLASPEEVKAPRVSQESVARLEQVLDQFNQQLPPLTEFVLPGGSRGAALLHLARGVVRRAERRIVRLSREVNINGTVIAYVNRLSDLLFVLARVTNQRLGVQEEPADFSRRSK